MKNRQLQATIEYTDLKVMNYSSAIKYKIKNHLTPKRQPTIEKPMEKPMKLKILDEKIHRINHHYH
jgi:hypothetical protein